MAGTVTILENEARPVTEVKFSLTSSAGGAADGTSTYYLNGRVAEVQIVPGSGGNAPTDLFDIVITDANSIDVLYGTGANCSNANNTILKPDSHIANSQLTIAATNMGNAKTATVIVKIAERV